MAEDKDRRDVGAADAGVPAAAAGAPSASISARCLKCAWFSSQLAWGSVRYCGGLLFSIGLGALYLIEDDIEEGVTTLFWLALPLVALALVNCMESNLRVTTPQGSCLQYAEYLPPMSKWRRLRAHRVTHEAGESTPARAEIVESEYHRTLFNAAILDDVEICFHNAPQLVFQLSLILRSMTYFDGDLIGALTLTNIFKLCSIMHAAWSCVVVLVNKLDKQLVELDEPHAREAKKITFISIISRVGFILVYSAVASVHPACVSLLLAAHWLSVVAYLLVHHGCSRPGLRVLEALLHACQYVVWEGEEYRTKQLALLVAAVAEWLVFVAGLAYVLQFDPQLKMIYVPCFLTHLILALLMASFVTIRCCLVGARGSNTPAHQNIDEHNGNDLPDKC